MAAKSGSLVGVVRNEADVATDPSGASFAVAIFTRSDPGRPPEPAAIDTAIGQLARRLVSQLQHT